MSQPLIIEKNTVVEISRYTAIDKPSNAEFTCNLSQPISISEGDSIMLKQVFIQNKEIDIQSIEIERDMNVKFQFIYYLNATGLNQYIFQYSSTNELTITDFESAMAIDGLPYMLVDQRLQNQLYNNSNYGRPVIEEVSITLNKGIYAQQSIADLVTRQLQSVNTQNTNNYPAESGGIQFTSGTIIPYYDISNNFQNFSVPQHPPPSSQIATTLYKQLYYMDLSSYPGVFPFNGSLFYMDSQNNPIFCKLIAMVNPTQANYATTYNNSVEEIFVPVMNMTTSEGKYEPQPCGGMNFTYNGTEYSVDILDCGFIGVSEPALLYNDTQSSGKYSFQLHTPILQDGNIVVGSYIYNAGATVPQINSNKVSFLQSYGGIMFVNIYETFSYSIQEIELLNLLGFKRSDLIPVNDIPLVWSYNNNLIVPQPQSNYHYFNYSSYLNYCTRGFFPIQGLSSNFTYQANQLIKYGGSNAQYNMILPSSIFITNAQTGFNFIQSTNSTSVIASSFAIISINNAGHFLLEISGYNNDYITSSKLMNVKATIGNYLYGNNGFSQTLGPDPSSTYQHYGIPLSLSSISVRIINPISKSVVPDYILGENSSIYLQIISSRVIEESTIKK